MVRVGAHGKKPSPGLVKVEQGDCVAVESADHPAAFHRGYVPHDDLWSRAPLPRGHHRAGGVQREADDVVLVVGVVPGGVEIEQ